MNCIEIFESCGSNMDLRASCIEEAGAHFVCECEPCSIHSPGIIAPDERLVFILVDPIHYDPDRETISSTAFQELTKRDLSVVRLDRSKSGDVLNTIQKLVDRGLDRLPQQYRTVREACVVDAVDVRAIKIDDQRVFGLYDTALADQEAHASIFTISKFRVSKNERKRATNRIYELLANRRRGLDDLMSEIGVGDVCR